MPSAPARRGLAVRLLRVSALAAAALPLAVAAPALAQGGSPTGGTVVGQLVQAYPESARENGPLAAAPLSWVQPAAGRAVRVDTGDVGGITPGSTVRVTVGDTVRDAGTGEGYGAAHSVTAATVLATPEPGTDGDTTPDTVAPTGVDETTPDGTTSGDPTSGDPTSGDPTSGDPTSGDPTSGDDTGQDGDTPAIDLSGAAPDLTDRVTVVLAEPGGGSPDATSLQGLVDTVNGPVHDFWSEQTGGAIRLGVTAAHDWITTTVGCGDALALWDKVAAEVGFTGGPRNHLLVYVSRDAADPCPFYGLAEVGAGIGSGGRLYVSDTLPSLIAHELGHNFGLGHSSERQCDGAVDTGSCQTAGYRDYYDVMGASWQQMGTLNAAQEARLGVLPTSQRRTVTADQTGGAVTLAPLSGRSGIRALHLHAPGTDYWLEYRTASGQDAWLGTGADWLGLKAGVLLHRSAGLPDTSLLLDGTPSARAGWDHDLDVPLPVGVAVPLADGFTVTVTAQSARGASVTVTTTAPERAQAPAATPSSAGTGVMPGGSCTADCTDPSGGSSAPASGTGPQRVAPPIPLTTSSAENAAPMTPAALRSPTVLAAVAALGCGVLFLGWLVVSRIRGARRRAR